MPHRRRGRRVGGGWSPAAALPSSPLCTWQRMRPQPVCARTHQFVTERRHALTWQRELGPSSSINWGGGEPWLNGRASAGLAEGARFNPCTPPSNPPFPPSASKFPGMVVKQASPPPAFPADIWIAGVSSRPVLGLKRPSGKKQARKHQKFPLQKEEGGQAKGHQGQSRKGAAGDHQEEGPQERTRGGLLEVFGNPPPPAHGERKGENHSKRPWKHHRKEESQRRRRRQKQQPWKEKPWEPPPLPRAVQLCSECSWASPLSQKQLDQSLHFPGPPRPPSLPQSPEEEGTAPTC